MKKTKKLKEEVKTLGDLTIENAPNVSTVISKTNPEWGTKAFTYVGGNNSYHGRGVNSALLSEDEYKFWSIASFKQEEQPFNYDTLFEATPDVKLPDPNIELKEETKTKDAFAKSIGASGDNWRDAFKRRVNTAVKTINDYIIYVNKGDSENAEMSYKYVWEEIEMVDELGFEAKDKAKELQRIFSNIHNTASTGKIGDEHKLTPMQFVYGGEIKSDASDKERYSDLIYNLETVSEKWVNTNSAKFIEIQNEFKSLHKKLYGEDSAYPEIKLFSKEDELKDGGMLYVKSSEWDAWEKDIEALYNKFHKQDSEFVSSKDFEAFEREATSIFEKYFGKPKDGGFENKEIFIGNVSRYVPNPAREFVMENISRFVSFKKYSTLRTEEDKYASELLRSIHYINYLKEKRNKLKDSKKKAELQKVIDDLEVKYKELQESADKKSLGGLLFGAVLGVAGTYAYQNFKTEDNKAKVTESNKARPKYEGKLPSKIAQWYDENGATKSGKWTGNTFPKEFHYYYKFNDKTNKWETIPYREHSLIFISGKYESGSGGKKFKEKNKTTVWKLQTT